MDVALIVSGALFVSIGLPRIVDKSHRAPVPPFVGKILDSGIRRWAQSPNTVIERSGINRDMHVLDLGCGSGAMTIVAARAVGEKGKVYAVDIQQGMLRQLECKLAKSENQDIRNVEVRQASAYNLPFESESLDLVYMVASLQEMGDREKALAQVRMVLKPGGVLAVTEFLPDTDYPLRSTTIKLCKRAGFIVDESIGSFWNYTITFRKPVPPG